MDKVMSGLGIIAVLTFLYAISGARKSINKRTILVGVGFQLALSFFLIKFPIGKVIIAKLATGITTVFGFAREGLGFVFGDLAGQGFFFIDVLGIIVFLSALTGILSYLGVIGFITKYVGGAVGKLLGTEKAESLVAVANTFLGQTESPVIIQKYLPKMTNSELMVVMVSGMGSMSASILVGYNMIGIPMDYLLIASAMGLIGSLIVSKMLLPETEVSEIKEVVIDRKGDNTNIFSAMSVGIMNGMGMALAVGASLIASISLITMLDAGLGLVGLSFAGILGVVFMPLGWLLGLTGAEASIAGEILGLKLTINEFVAYAELAPILSDLSSRAQMLISIAVGSFGALSSIAIMITGLAVFAPERKNDLGHLATRGVIGGFLVPVLSAMFVGLFI